MNRNKTIDCKSGYKHKHKQVNRSNELNNRTLSELRSWTGQIVQAQRLDQRLPELGLERANLQFAKRYRHMNTTATQMINNTTQTLETHAVEAVLGAVHIVARVLLKQQSHEASTISQTQTSKHAATTNPTTTKRATSSSTTAAHTNTQNKAYSAR